MGSDGQHDLAIRRLQQMGGQHRQVTLDQVKSVLPIDEMTPGEIAQAMMHLEEAGVEVSLEEDLLRPRPGSVDDPNDPPADPAFGVHDPERAAIIPPAISPGWTAPSAGSSGAGRGGPGPRQAAALALVAVLGLLVLSVMLLALTS